MDRRAFLGGLATVLLVPPPAAAPQSAGPPLRVGVIAINPRSAPFLVAFEDRLRDLGWVDGKNMTIVFRIAKGYVASVARPGGNITGVWTLGREQGPKQLELMRELLPKVTRIAVLWEAYSADQVSAIEEAGASTPGVQIEKLEVRPPYDFERAFLALRHQRVGTVLVVSSPIFFRERARIAQLALKHRLPAGGALNGVDAGLLLGFGVDPSVS